MGSAEPIKQIEVNIVISVYIKLNEVRLLYM